MLWRWPVFLSYKKIGALWSWLNNWVEREKVLTQSLKKEWTWVIGGSITIRVITVLHLKVTSAYMLKLTFYPLGHNFFFPTKFSSRSYLWPFKCTLIKEKWCRLISDPLLRWCRCLLEDRRQRVSLLKPFGQVTAQALCSCVRTHHFVACPQFQKLN